VVAIDCRSVRLCFILDFWRMIAAASIELILNLLTAKASNRADRSSFASTLGT
jgi:hypothetical protein